MSNSVSSNYAVVASGDNFIPNIAGDNVVGEQIFAPLSIITNAPAAPVIASFTRPVITLGTATTPVNILGATGTGRVYDTVNNVPTPSVEFDVVATATNTLVPTVFEIPPGTYIFKSNVLYSGAGKVLPAGGVIQLFRNSAETETIASYIVPTGLAGDFTDSRLWISTVLPGDTFSLGATAGINLGADGLFSCAVTSFCGPLPA